MFSTSTRRFKERMLPYFIWDIKLFALKKQRLLYGLVMQTVFLGIAYMIYFMISRNFFYVILPGFIGSIMLAVILYVVLMELKAMSETHEVIDSIYVIKKVT